MTSAGKRAQIERDSLCLGGVTENYLIPHYFDMHLPRRKDEPSKPSPWDIREMLKNGSWKITK